MADKKMTTPASVDNPRTLKRQSDGARARVTDPTEYLTMTTAQGYHDVTDGGDSGGKGSRKGSSNAGSGGSGGGSGDGSESQAGSGGTA